MSSERDHTPWVRYRNTSLYCVPSIHHRLIFSQLVVEACRKKQFDVIAVELPKSQQGNVNQALSLLPHPVLQIEEIIGETESLKVPRTAHPEDKEEVLVEVKRGLVTPFTISDSIVTALRCPHLLKDEFPDWAPEIRFIDNEYYPADREDEVLIYKDDYEVQRLGIGHFYNRLSVDFEKGKDPIIDEVREQIMAAQLGEALHEGKEILFVCGAAHWENICRILDSERVLIEELNRYEVATTEGDRINHVVPIEPFYAWAWGWLDDYPNLTWEFEQSIVRREWFDKAKVSKRLTREAAYREKVSMRKLLTMEAFCDRLLASEGRWVPQLTNHLCFSAESCVGKKFSDNLLNHGIGFPSQLPEGTSNAGIRGYGLGKWLVYFNDDIFLIEFPKPKINSGGQRIIRKPGVSLSEKESRSLNDLNLSIRDWPEEQKLHYLMDDAARELAGREEVSETYFSTRFQGHIGDGLDCKKTIRAIAAGDNSIFVRNVRKKALEPARAPSIPITPVVWIFDESAEIIATQSNTGWLEHGVKFACLSYLYLSGMEDFPDKQIRKLELAAMVDLARSRAFCGKARPSVDDGETEARVDSEYLNSLPEDKLCIHPESALWSEDSLLGISELDEAIALAIKYCKDRIILVCSPKFAIDEAVEEYAARRKVRITRVSIDAFSQERLDRFRLFHWVPSSGDGWYGPPHEWCHRYIPEI